MSPQLYKCYCINKSRQISHSEESQIIYVDYFTFEEMDSTSLLLKCGLVTVTSFQRGWYEKG